MPRIRFLLAISSLLSTQVAALARGEDDPQDWTIKPLGLRIVASAPEVQGFPRPFNWNSGTTTALQCSPPSGFVLGYDSRRSAIATFVDERGNNLAGEHRDGRLHGFTFRSGGFSHDHRHALIELFGVGVPVAGSTSFALQGELMFVVAGQKKVHIHAQVPLKTGQEIVVGDQTIVLKEVRPPANGRRGLDVVILANGKIGDVRFFSDEGNVFRARKTAYHTIGSDKLASKNETTWRLSDKLEVASLEIDEWKDVDTVVVPFDVTVSVGLNTEERN